MNRQRAILYFCAFFMLGMLNAQPPTGEWQDHSSFFPATALTYGNNKVYASAPSGLFYFDQKNNVVEKITRNKGLSDVNIQKIQYIDPGKFLIIAYENGNLDIIDENGIHNIPFIKEKQIPASKSIQDIEIIQDLAYLSYGFGIVVLDYKNLEIKETYFPGNEGNYVNILDVTSDKDLLYAVTEKSILYADLDDPNLIDYTSWEKDSSLIDSIEYEINNLVYLDNSLYTLLKSTDTNRVYKKTDTTWMPVVIEGITNDIHTLKASREKLLLIGSSDVYIYNVEDHSYSKASHYGNRDALLDEEETLYIASSISSLVKMQNGKAVETYYPNGPRTKQCARIISHKDIIFGTRGGHDATYTQKYLHGSFYRFGDERKWENFFTYSFRDFTSIAVDPTDKSHLYIGAWGHGLHEFKDMELIRSFTHENTNEHTLRSIFEGSPYIRIGGITFDSDQNLWITNAGVPEKISVLTPEGQWYGFNYSPLKDVSDIGDIIIDNNNRKWVLIPRRNGVFVFDSGDNIASISDDQYKKLEVTDEKGENLNDVYSLAMDLDGNIWVGTSRGPAIYYNYQDVLNQNVFAHRIIIGRDDESGLGDYLLETETISAIAIDGANRKWFGTANNGAFLISENGEKEILHFTNENSPLPSNYINDIAINHYTGEVFFATNEGIVSYGGSASAGYSSYSSIKAYPNPVREDYFGNITIIGFKRNSEVRITSVDGDTVFEGRSLGGRILWDGNNMNGNRVSSGVYMVFMTDENGEESMVSKILVIR